MYPINLGTLIIIIANIGVTIRRIKIKKRKADKETQKRHVMLH